MRSYILDQKDLEFNDNYKKETQDKLGKKYFYMVHNFIGENLDGTVCLFPSIDFMFSFIKESKKEKNSRNLFPKGEFFFENSSLEENFFIN